MRSFVYDIALTTSFRGITRRRGMIFEGPAGWAEWSPFPEYDDVVAARWLAATIEAAELGFPAPVRDTVPVNAIVPAVAPEAAAARVREAGCRTAKVKVAQAGETLDDDVARVSAVRDQLGAGGLIRVDANAAWDVPAALRALRELAQFGLEYAEQPCRTVAELRQLRRELDAAGIAVPIAADESIRQAADPLAVRDIADVAILKVQPLGGVRACLELAEQLGLPAVVSSALETSVGLRAGVALAAALPSLPHACGLETASLLVDDVAREPLRAVGGELPVGEVMVLPDALERVAAGGEVALWWRQRLSRAAALLGRPELEES